jgi:hypothetical protein
MYGSMKKLEILAYEGRLSKETGSVCYDADVEDAESALLTPYDYREHDRGSESESSSTSGFSQVNPRRREHTSRNCRRERSSSFSRLPLDDATRAPCAKRSKLSLSCVRHPTVDPTCTTVLTSASYDELERLQKTL